ncbi:hypothetical protein OG426_53395 [Streptomyces canus]|uniref:hypothetical protein n=1 Tax=Streptomyces canus TaxID=58343 RepID=UPI002251FBF1|nr:hypothetical protein [Streptomyces canus]MCX4853942.1 hypothetical protein [Streptomyces canus]WSW40596.1 hypothetical protein OG426_53395 [Streptomyces canus]
MSRSGGDGRLPHQCFRLTVEAVELHDEHPVDDAHERVDGECGAVEAEPGRVRGGGDVETADGVDAALLDEPLTVGGRGTARGAQSVTAGPYVVDTDVAATAN